jgi:hypothetical protein
MRKTTYSNSESNGAYNNIFHKNREISILMMKKKQQG